MLLVFRGGVVSAPELGGIVYPSSTLVQMGYGGSFRKVLQDEVFVVGLWPLSELGDPKARDISGNRKHGDYLGNEQRGISGDLPEGNLGVHLSGSDYIDLGDDSDDLDLDLNMDLAFGGMEIVALMRTSQDDATERYIIQKKEVTGTFQGWGVAVVSGTIRFSFIDATGTVFSFDRGSGLADGAWHLINCVYRPTGFGARVYIDGVQSGADVAATRENIRRACNCQIGQHANLGRFVGDLSYVMIGREHNTAMPALLQATRVWTTATTDVKAPIRWRRGIPGRGPLDRVATTGTMSLTLNNAVRVGGLLGRYSPGHANCIAGFGINTPVRLEITHLGTTYYQFRGYIKSVRPVAGQAREREVAVTVVDWMDTAATVVLSALEAQIDRRSDDVFRIVTDQTDETPPAISIGVGSETFPYSLDNSLSEYGTPMEEYARIALSELSNIYIRGDTVQGAVLTYEPRSVRQSLATNAVTFDNTMVDLDVAYDRDELINRVRAVVYPRDVDADFSTVLYSLQDTQEVGPGITATWEFPYRDPNQRAARVGGIFPAGYQPESMDDYTFNASPDGSGADLTADVAVDAELGANAVVFTVTNNSGQTAYTGAGAGQVFQVRGKGVYYYERAIVPVEDAPSVQRYRAHPINLEMPYQVSLAKGRAAGSLIVHQHKDPQALVRSVTLHANRDATLLTHALARDIGDRIGLIEPVTGVTTTVDGSPTAERGFHIQEVRGELTQGRDGAILRMSWGLTPALPTGFWRFGVVGASEFGQTTRMGI